MHEVRAVVICFGTRCKNRHSFCLLKNFAKFARKRISLLFLLCFNGSLSNFKMIFFEDYKFMFFWNKNISIYFSKLKLRVRSNKDSQFRSLVPLRANLQRFSLPCVVRMRLVDFCRKGRFNLWEGKTYEGAFSFQENFENLLLNLRLGQ